MRIAVSLALIGSVLLADTFKSINHLTYLNSEKTVDGSKSSKAEIVLNTNNTYKSSDTVINGQFILTKPYSEQNRYSEGEKPYIYVRSATVERKIGDNTSVTGGVISFMDDCYVDNQIIKRNSRNNGISSMIQTTYDAVFVTHRLKVFGDLKLKIGTGSYNKLTEIPKEYALMKENSGSHGYFLLADHTTENNKFEFNMFDTEMHLYGRNIGSVNVFGISNVYSEDLSGLEYYGAISKSLTEKRGGSDWSSALMADRGINPMAPYVYPNLFNFETEKGSGYNYVLGVSKEFDIDGVNLFKVGFDHYYASRNYLNLVGPDSGKSWNYDNKGRGNRIFLSVQKDNIGLNFCLSQFKRESVTRIGGLFGQEVPGSTGLPNDGKLINSVGLSVFYKF